LKPARSVATWLHYTRAFPRPAVEHRSHSAAAGRAGKTTDWLVYKIGGRKAGLLGTVRAADYEGALAAALAEFEIPPHDRKRILVQPTG
jgi:hypothetical protein